MECLFGVQESDNKFVRQNNAVQRSIVIWLQPYLYTCDEIDMTTV
jgi:hypothetical protein